jgi:hypothetical protein
VRLPRDLNGRELAILLDRHYGYKIARQSGSHLRFNRAAPAHKRTDVRGTRRPAPVTGLSRRVEGHALTGNPVVGGSGGGPARRHQRWNGQAGVRGVDARRRHSRFSAQCSRPNIRPKGEW